MEYNIIMPVAYKDYNFLNKIIRFVQAFLCPQKIYIITEIRLKRLLPVSVRHNQNVIILDENSLCPGLTYKSVQSLLFKHGCVKLNPGWFLQQFLKYAFAQSEFCDTEYYLSWDADTIPLSSINFFDRENNPLFTIKKEHHQPYFDTISNLFRSPNIADHSFIAEHMLFNKLVVQKLIDTINNSGIKGDTWFEQIINATNPAEPNSFSEFETYGTYCYNYHPNMYKSRTLNTFRRGGLIAGRFISNKLLQKLSIDLDIISFEISDYPCGVEHTFAWLYEKYIKGKGRIIKKIIRQ